MPKTCFVIQGFGKKPDFQSGRTLDLDASYEVLKAAVTTAGLSCVRGDEIPQSGSIDRVMYEQLLQADLVIADALVQEAHAQARSVRRRVVDICSALLSSGQEMSKETRYWVLATSREASVGLGDEEGATQWTAKARDQAPATWHAATGPPERAHPDFAETFA